MFLLLATGPYLAALISYWALGRDIFARKETDDEVPANWMWRLVAPVLVGGLTPLAVAVKASDSQRGWLLFAVALAILFTFANLQLLSSDQKYFDLQRLVRVGKRELRWMTWQRLLMIGGSTILIFAGTLNLLVGASDSGKRKSAAPPSQKPAAPAVP